ncbi:hypothetical protein [Desulfitobacterium sp. Sab5]|uniref:hypothetical protein n=1 Tax=Desulfitobacterium TaxID=36853 RepID=UPI003CEF9E69
MLRRLIREINIELYWLKKDFARRWKMDTPVGLMGIIAIVTGFVLFVILIQGIAEIIRGTIPWVAGSRIAETYWSSIGYALKASLAFLAFSVSIILFFLMKLFYKR